jgi:hypothetical protein
MLGLIGTRRLLVFEEGNSDRRIFFRGRHPILVFGGNTQKILSSSAVGGTGRVPGKTGLPISRKNLPSGGLVVISCTTASLDFESRACATGYLGSREISFSLVTRCFRIPPNDHPPPRL